MDSATLLNFFYDNVLPGACSLEEIKIFLACLRLQMRKKSPEVIVEDKLAFFSRSTGLDAVSIKRGVDSCVQKGWLKVQEVNGKGAMLSIIVHAIHDHENIYIFHDHESTCMSGELTDVLTGYFGFSASFAKRLLAKFGESKVEKKIREFRYIRENNIYLIANPAGYLRKSLEENYPSPTGFSNNVTSMDHPSAKVSGEKLIEEAKKRIAPGEMEEICDQARARLKKDLGRSLGKMPQAAMDAYIAIIIGERLGINVAA